MTAATTCPHCARVLRGKAVQQHICPEDPANRAIILAALEQPACPGVARSAVQYAAVAVMAGAPSATTIRDHFGSWPAVVAYFGLAQNTGQCPHCRRGMQDYSHVERCPAHPKRRALVLAALTDPDNPGCAVGPSAYELRGNGTGAPSRNTLRATFGNWNDACEFFGLTYTGPQEVEAAAIAQVAAAVDEDRAMQRELAVRGLEVCRVRSLPDGRVACMLR